MGRSRHFGQRDQRQSQPSTPPRPKSPRPLILDRLAGIRAPHTSAWPSQPVWPSKLISPLHWLIRPMAPGSITATVRASVSGASKSLLSVSLPHCQGAADRLEHPHRLW